MTSSHNNPNSKAPALTLLPVSTRILADFTGSNFLALAIKYRLTVQAVYACLRAHQILEQLDQGESSVAPPHLAPDTRPEVLWEGSLHQLAHQAGTAALLQAVHTALSLDQQGHAQLVLHSLAPQPPADVRLNSQACPAAAEATSQPATPVLGDRAQQSPAAREFPTASSFSPVDELMQQATRRNGKCLITRAEAEETLRSNAAFHKASSEPQVAGRHPAPARTQQQLRATLVPIQRALRAALYPAPAATPPSLQTTHSPIHRALPARSAAMRWLVQRIAALLRARISEPRDQ